MSLRIERIPTLGDNYTYLAICDETQEAAIIDAPEEDPVVRRVEATGAKVKLILSTHHHYDHSMANPQLAERYGVSPATAGLVSTAQVGSFLVATFGAGRYLRPRASVVRTALYVLVAANLASAIAPTLALLLALLPLLVILSLLPLLVLLLLWSSTRRTLPSTDTAYAFTHLIVGTQVGGYGSCN